MMLLKTKREALVMSPSSLHYYSLWAVCVSAMKAETRHSNLMSRPNNREPQNGRKPHVQRKAKEDSRRYSVMLKKRKREAGKQESIYHNQKAFIANVTKQTFRTCYIAYHHCILVVIYSDITIYVCRGACRVPCSAP